mgnify:CR=1 FL=1
MFKLVKTISDAFGNDINLYAQTCTTAKENILLVARFHGDEPEGEFCLRELMKEAQDQELVSPYNIYITPCLNPSGKELFTRANGHKIDLNRNYPTQNFTDVSFNPHTKELSSGTPASEIETKFMIETVIQYNFVRILSIHSDLHLIDYDGPARDLALRFSAMCHYKLVDNIGYATNGSFGTWVGIEKQIPLITVETWHAENENDMAKIWSELKPAIWDFCKLTSA